MVSLMVPISRMTFIVVAMPTINAPGATTDTACRAVSLISLGESLATIPEPSAMMMNIAEISWRYQW